MDSIWIRFQEENRRIKGAITVAIYITAGMACWVIPHGCAAKSHIDHIVDMEGGAGYGQTVAGGIVMALGAAIAIFIMLGMAVDLG